MLQGPENKGENENGTRQPEQMPTIGCEQASKKDYKSKVESNPHGALGKKHPISSDGSDPYEFIWVWRHA